MYSRSTRSVVQLSCPDRIPLLSCGLCLTVTRSRNSIVSDKCTRRRPRTRAPSKAPHTPSPHAHETRDTSRSSSRPHLSAPASHAHQATRSSTVDTGSPLVVCPAVHTNTAHATRCCTHTALPSTCLPSSHSIRTPRSRIHQDPTTRTRLPALSCDRHTRSDLPQAPPSHPPRAVQLLP